MKKQEASDPDGVFPTTPLQAGLQATTLQNALSQVFNNADKKLHSRLYFTFPMSVRTEMRPKAQISWTIETQPQSQAFGFHH